MEAGIAGCEVVISQSGFSGEKGYEIYLRDATVHAEKLWNAVLEAGKAHQLMVIAPGHQRRIQAGIMSWGQDIDHETLPFQCNLAYQVPRKKKGDYIGKAALERVRAQIDAGRPPFKMTMVGMTIGGKPIDDYAPDFWLVSDAGGGDPIGYLTSPWYAPELGCNISWATCRWSNRPSARTSPCGCRTSMPASRASPSARRCARSRSGRRSIPAHARSRTPAARTPRYSAPISSPAAPLLAHPHLPLRIPSDMSLTRQIRQTPTRFSGVTAGIADGEPPSTGSGCSVARSWAFRRMPAMAALVARARAMVCAAFAPHAPPDAQASLDRAEFLARAGASGAPSCATRRCARRIER